MSDSFALMSLMSEHTCRELLEVKGKREAHFFGPSSLAKVKLAIIETPSKVNKE